ncbi:MAG: hypothetical protein ABIP17_10030 [Ilumatobacteraceae bacterium]
MKTGFARFTAGQAQHDGSPLGRVRDLEALMAAASDRVALWSTVAGASAVTEVSDDAIGRASIVWEHLERLTLLHDEAVSATFGRPEVSGSAVER